MHSLIYQQPARQEIKQCQYWKLVCFLVAFILFCVKAKDRIAGIVYKYGNASQDGFSGKYRFFINVGAYIHPNIYEEPFYSISRMIRRISRLQSPSSCCLKPQRAKKPALSAGGEMRIKPLSFFRA